MIVQFAGKHVVIPHGYKKTGDNLFCSNSGTEYRLIQINDTTIKLESIQSKRVKRASLDVIESRGLMSTLQFINTYLKGRAIVSIIDDRGVFIFRGMVSDLPRHIIDHSVVASVKGLGSMDDIVIRIEYLSYDK